VVEPDLRRAIDAKQRRLSEFGAQGCRGGADERLGNGRRILGVGGGLRRCAAAGKQTRHRQKDDTGY
jgi:hypothetical protein